MENQRVAYRRLSLSIGSEFALDLSVINNVDFTSQEEGILGRVDID